MNIIDRPFSKLIADDIPRLWLPIVIKNPHTELYQSVFGLIDTGADECAIPADFATMIGHDLQKGVKKLIRTANGETAAYSHTMSIETDGIVIDNVLIDFMPNLPVVLLGVKNFLSNFILTVDYKNYIFSLREHTPEPVKA